MRPFGCVTFFMYICALIINYLDMAAVDVFTTADFIPMDELKRLIKCLRDDENYKWELYFRLAFCTGLRYSDIKRIKWSHLLSGESFDIREKKTGKHRHITISETNQKIFAELHQLLGAYPDFWYVMAPEARNQSVTVQYANQKCRAFKKLYDIKIENFSTHSVRKAFARHIWDSRGQTDAALVIISEILNHANIATTRKYLGITSEEIKEIYNTLNIDI